MTKRGKHWLEIASCALCAVGGIGAGFFIVSRAEKGSGLVALGGLLIVGGVFALSGIYSLLRTLITGREYHEVNRYHTRTEAYHCPCCHRQIHTLDIPENNSQFQCPDCKTIITGIPE